jgi:hypothetical protein
MVTLVLFTASFSAQADELVSKTETDDNNTDKPDIGFLEFLGEWETPSGEWIDPNQLDARITLEKEKEQQK